MIDRFIKVYGVPEKVKPVKGCSFMSKCNRKFCKCKNNDVDYSPTRLPTGTGVVERATLTLKKINIANLEGKIDFTDD